MLGMLPNSASLANYWALLVLLMLLAMLPNSASLANSLLPNSALGFPACWCC